MNTKKPSMYLDSNVFGSFRKKHPIYKYNYYSFINSMNSHPKLPNTNEFLITNTIFSEFEKMGIKRKDFIENLENLDSVMRKSHQYKKCLEKVGDEEFTRRIKDLGNYLDGYVEREIEKSSSFNLNYFNHKYFESYSHVPTDLKAKLKKFFLQEGETCISYSVVENWKASFIIDVLASLKPPDDEIGKELYWFLVFTASVAKEKSNWSVPMTRIAYNMLLWMLDSDRKSRKSKEEREWIIVELCKAEKFIKYRQNEDMVDAELVHCAVLEDSLSTNAAGIPYFFTCDPIERVLTRVSHYKSYVKMFNEKIVEFDEYYSFHQRKESFLVFLSRDNLEIEKIIKMSDIPDLFEWLREGYTLDQMINNLNGI